MKSVLVLCVLAAAAAATQTGKQIQADKDFVQKQLSLSTLFFDNDLRPEVEKIAHEFDFAKQEAASNNPKAVKLMHKMYQSGRMLTVTEQFNYYNPEHLQQAIRLFDVFYFAKDFSTFYYAACWAFNNINFEQFTYALSVAILNRADTQGVVLPPRSEFNAYLYVDARAIRAAHRYKQQQYKSATVHSNTTDFYQNQYNQNYKHSQQDQQHQHNFGQVPLVPNQEGPLSYFTEDVGLSSQFAYERLKNPAWLNNNKYNQKQVPQNKYQNDGESFYYYLHQLLARYNLERYANKMPKVQAFEYSQRIRPGYKPNLHYRNGQAVSPRSDYANYIRAEPFDAQNLEIIDRRLADAVDNNQALAADGSKVKLNNESGVKILGSMVQNSGENINSQFYSAGLGFYGWVDQFRRVIGSLPYEYCIAPSAIQNDDSALKDPVFYQGIARVLGFFHGLKSKLKPYAQEQLAFSGVEVQSVSTDKLVTYFEDAPVDLWNVIYYEKSEVQQKHKYFALQRQLNSKPFSYQIQVNSDKAADAIVRVFIGPQYIDFEEARSNFVEIDRFTVKLNNGQNNIQRGSDQSTRFYSQQAKTLDVFVPLMNAYLKGGAFFYNPDNNQQQASFPANLILPKGDASGMEYVMVVAVSPFQGSAEEQGQPEDGKPQGFPLDRPVSEYQLKHAKNIFLKTVTIFSQEHNDEPSKAQ